MAPVSGACVMDMVCGRNLGVAEVTNSLDYKQQFCQVIKCY